MQATSDTRPKKFVFTLMPFSEAFDDIYKLGIKPACESAGAYCERIDEQIFNENILLRLYNQINRADLIVADMTGRNPNVFYETGYAHALNKRVILLTQREKDIPFDLKHYPHIVYSGKIAFLKDELHRRAQWYLDQPEQVVADRTPVLKYYLFKQIIEEGVEISANPYFREENMQFHTLKLEFDVHNPTFEFVETSNIYYTFIFTDTNQYGNLKYDVDNIKDYLPLVLLPDRTVLVEPINFSRLLPQGWASRIFQIDYWQTAVTTSMTMILRITSENGIKDIPFKLKINIYDSILS